MPHVCKYVSKVRAHHHHHHHHLQVNIELKLAPKSIQHISLITYTHIHTQSVCVLHL